jgi:hypothetical protein
MSQALFKQTLEEMVAKNQEVFDKFSAAHALFSKDQDKYKKEFDEVGKPALRLIEEAENRLCRKMETGGRGKFSANLAEKFRSEVRKRYPLVDLVGVIIT